MSSIALEKGVWIYPSGSGIFEDAVMFGPPFTVEEGHIDEMVTTTRQAIDTAVSQVS